MKLIDTHAHLTMLAETEDLAAVLTRSRQAGVDSWIAIGTDVPDSEATLRLCEQWERMYCTVGVHPHQAADQADDYIEQLRILAGEPQVVAIGEIGLDYHYDFSPRDKQRQAFAEQLDLATEFNLPVVVHCREALDDCLAVLDAWGSRDKLAVFHCFGGGPKEVQAVMVRGFYVSYTGTLTFANAQTVRDAAKHVPRDRVFIETDCPYLSPEPKRNVRPNEPALLVHTAAKLAQVHGVTEAEIAKITTENSCVFFGLD